MSSDIRSISMIHEDLADQYFDLCVTLDHYPVVKRFSDVRRAEVTEERISSILDRMEADIFRLSSATEDEISEITKSVWELQEWLQDMSLKISIEREDIERRLEDLRYFGV